MWPREARCFLRIQTQPAIRDSTASDGCLIRDCPSEICCSVKNMRSCGLFICLALSGLLISPRAKSTVTFSSANETSARVFVAKGVVKEINSAAKTIFIQHDAISNYMSAMTMPFNVKNINELAGLNAGDKISFQLHVTETESW